MDLVILVVGGVLHRDQAAMEIKKRDFAGKSKRRSGHGNDADFARQAAVRAGRGKAHVHQRSRLHVLKGRGGLAVADAGFRIDGEAHRHGIERVTQGKFVVPGVNGDDLAVGVRGQLSHANAYVAGKNIVLVVVKLRVNVNALALFNGQLRGFPAVMEDVRALVKINGPVAAAKNMHRHLVAQAINAADGASNHGCSGARHGRGIKNGIVPVCNQRAGRGGAIKNVSLGLRLRNRSWRSGGGGVPVLSVLLAFSSAVDHSWSAAFCSAVFGTSNFGRRSYSSGPSPLAGLESAGCWPGLGLPILSGPPTLADRPQAAAREQEWWPPAAMAQHSGQAFAECRNRALA